MPLSSLRVLRVAVSAGVDYEDLVAELQSNGYDVSNPEFNVKVIEGLLVDLPHLRLIEDKSDATLRINEDVRGIEGLLLQLGPERMADCAQRLSAAGVANTWTMRSSSGQYVVPSRHHRHSEVIPPHSLRSIVLGPAELVAFAQRLELSLGEAINELYIYKGLVKEWHIPEDMPHELSDRHPGRSELVWFEGPAFQGTRPTRNAAWWMMKGLRASAVVGGSIEDRIQVIRPLLHAFGEDTALLDLVAEKVTRPLDFNDLLIIGTQQLSPPITDIKEIVAMCSPVATDTRELGARAEFWKSLNIEIIKEAWPLWED